MYIYIYTTQTELVHGSHAPGRPSKQRNGLLNICISIAVLRVSCSGTCELERFKSLNTAQQCTTTAYSGHELKGTSYGWGPRLKLWLVISAPAWALGPWFLAGD